MENNSDDDQASLDQWLLQQAQDLAQMLASGQFQPGATALRSLLVTYPGWGLGWKLQAAFLTSMACHEEAFQAVRMAAQLLPDDAELFNIAATLFRDSGQLDKAIRCYLRASELNPALPEVHNNLGGALMLNGEVDQAIKAFTRAVEIFPDYPEAQQNLGSALQVRNRFSEAIVAHLRAAELQPARQQALSMACLAMLQSAHWSPLSGALGQLQANLGRPHYQAPIPFVFNGLPGSTAQQQRRCAQQFGAEQYAGFLNQPPYCTRKMSGDERLRIGYLSADFHEHATAYLLVGVFECHDRAQFAIHAYSYGPSASNPMRQRIESACDVFQDVRTSSHEQAARLIAADNIDILVDLKGFTENGRPQITALHPAPVVVSWLGYPSTLGQRRLADYLIGDAVVTPLSRQADYSETLALMPDSYQPTDATRGIGLRPTRQAAGLPDDGLIFCSFNQIYKITPGVFDTWCRIVVANPGGVLWLLEGAQIAMDNLRREALARGLAAERLIFARKLPQADHLARLQLADLALDTFPYTSHTTGSDALWAGVPLLTRIGEAFGSRVAASLLSAAGLPELIVDDEEHYVQRAIQLARDGGKRAQLRAHLENGRGTLALFDTRRFTHHLETLFATIRQQHIAGVARSFAVSASR